jgi:mRNA interferase MazF
VPPPRWGEVWTVDLGEPIGHEQGRQRPAVVVSSDWFNETRAELHVVLPLSTKLRQLGTHLLIDPPEGGLDEPSDVMCEHIRAVSRERLLARRGKLDEATMVEVLKRLKVLLLLGPQRG